MGTRSRIGIRNDDDSVESIYCNWDGSPDYNGRILVNHYRDEAKVRELMALGDIYTLGAEIGTKHNFDNCPAGVCAAYGRDGDMTDCESEHHRNPQHMLNSIIDEEYWYIWHYGKWMVYGGGQLHQRQWRLVEDVLGKKN